MSDQAPSTLETSPPQIIEHKNDHLIVHVQMLPGCIAKIEVTVSPQGSKAVWVKAIKSVSKEISIPGFRKGKAPEEMILKNYSKYVEKEWEDKLLQVSVREALELASLEPYRKNSFSKVQFAQKSKDKDSKITFEIEHAPKVPLMKLSEITLTKVDPKVATKEDVQEQWKNLQLKEASWIDIEGRGAKKGDYVLLDMQSLDGESQPMICENTRFHVDEAEMSPWMYKLLIGLKPEETVEGVSEPDSRTEVEESEEKPFTPAHFKIVCKGLHQASLPEINDEFAAKFGADSVSDLESKIEKMLQNENNMAAWRDLEGQVLSQALEKYPFDIPMKECEEEKAAQTKRMQQQLKDQSLHSADRVRIMQEYARTIESIPVSYRLFFIAKQFANQYNIKVTEKELLDAVNEYYAQDFSRFPQKDVEEEIKRTQIMIFNQLILHKVVAFIIQHARYV